MQNFFQEKQESYKKKFENTSSYKNQQPSGQKYPTAQSQIIQNNNNNNTLDKKESLLEKYQKERE